MATLLLTAVGTAVAGPLGGALGGLLGQQADRAFFGSGSREGPRLRELAVTTSSYGHPIGRHFGRMRVAGTVIWATDLVENSSTQGGKGKPKTTTYSYSANFAVALSSTPIKRLGRIWADGNLLRGAGEDLKVEGELRFYPGHGDAVPDPLIVADRGDATPAFRDCAYAVFENLDLADFGNRIPALTFEIFNENESGVTLKQLVPEAIEAPGATTLRHVLGFADEGGAIGATLSSIERVFPLVCVTTSKGLKLSTLERDSALTAPLPAQLADETKNEAERRFKTRSRTKGQEPLALRYYDDERDYQPGVQRAIGRRPNGVEIMVDLPATLTARGAKALANDNANRARWADEELVWRIGELDPSIQPGRLATVPGHNGIWRIRTWEWFDQGIELELKRVIGAADSEHGADGGASNQPLDVAAGETVLHATELPPENATEPSRANIYAAASSPSENWSGAALYLEQGSALLPIGLTGRTRANVGVLMAALDPSPSLLFQPNASLEVLSVAADLPFADTDVGGLSAGANRLFIDGEVLQFLRAEPLGGGRWRLGGLLRGRAGTEPTSMQPHAANTPFILLDERLTDLTPSLPAGGPVSRVAAIGRGDQDAVFATLRNAGLSRRPPTPVHPRRRAIADGSVELCWTRRARGHWRWDFEDEVPLVEEAESYVVGYGDPAAPMAAYSTSAPRMVFTHSERQSLISQYGSADVWVRQIGTYARSGALLLTRFT